MINKKTLEVIVCGVSAIFALGERWVIIWHFRQPFLVTWVMTVLEGTNWALSLIRKTDPPFPFKPCGVTTEYCAWDQEESRHFPLNPVVSLQYIPSIMHMGCDLLWNGIGQFTYTLRGYFTGTGAIVWLPHAQWIDPEGYHRAITYIVIIILPRRLQLQILNKSRYFHLANISW